MPKKSKKQSKKMKQRKRVGSMSRKSNVSKLMQEAMKNNGRNPIKSHTERMPSRNVSAEMKNAQKNNGRFKLSRYVSAASKYSPNTN